MLEVLPNTKAIVNIGIAGADLPLGKVVIASEVRDAGNGKFWHPHLPPINKLPAIETTKILTVESPSNNYTASTAFDMEASGIVHAATKKLDLAFVHCLKVISDNPDNNVDTITAQSASKNIEQAIPAIVKLCEALPFDTQSNNSDVNDLFRNLTTRLHYTQTEQHKLRELLNRHSALMGYVPEASDFDNEKTARDVRAVLHHALQNAPIMY